MRKLIPLFLGLYLLSFSVSAGDHGAPGASTAELTKVPAVGLVSDKVPPKMGEKTFELPGAAVQRLDNWYREHLDKLQPKIWNDPTAVTDEQVRAVKKSLGSYLIADDIEKFSRSIKVAITGDGVVRIDIPSTGQSFTYKPGPPAKYRLEKN